MWLYVKSHFIETRAVSQVGVHWSRCTLPEPQLETLPYLTTNSHVQPEAPCTIATAVMRLLECNREGASQTLRREIHGLKHPSFPID